MILLRVEVGCMLVVEWRVGENWELFNSLGGEHGYMRFQGKLDDEEK